MRKQAGKTFRIIAAAVTVAWLSLCVIAPSVHAEAVYKCSGADGAVAFQDRPCLRTQVESQVEIAPPPAPAASPEYRLASRSDRGEGAAARTRTSRQANAGAAAEVVSYECRAANGELFYRHGACPHQITAKARGSNGASRKRSGADAQTYAVSAQALSRKEVCRRIVSAGSIGRAGRERDESVSTYERNLGRDPCRRF
jgi:uncharacterized protein DUF4124